MARYAEEIHPNRLLQSMNRHSSTLTSLSLTNVLEDCNVWTTGVPLGSLKTFSELRAFEADEKLLLGVVHIDDWQTMDFDDILPSSLGSLTIHSGKSLSKIGTLLRRLATFKGDRLTAVELTFPMVLHSTDHQELIWSCSPGFDLWSLEAVIYGEFARAKFGYNCPVKMSEALTELAENFDRDGIVTLLRNKPESENNPLYI